MKTFHDTSLAGHVGVAKTYELIRQRFFYPRLFRLVKLYCKTCKTCQTRNVSRAAEYGRYRPLPVPSEPWSIVSTDILGPFIADANRRRYIIVATDLTTRYIVTQALRTTSAKESAQFLLEKVILQFGCFRRLHSDRGGTYNSAVMHELCLAMGADQTFTSPYTPTANSVTERVNASIAAILAKFVGKNQKAWSKFLPHCTMAINGSVHLDMGFAPHFLMYGQNVRLPIDVCLPEAPPSLLTFLQILHDSRVLAHRQLSDQFGASASRLDGKTRPPPQFEIGDLVLLFIPTIKQGDTKKLMSRFYGPYELVAKTSETSYKLERSGRILNANVRRLRPFHPRAAFMSAIEDDPALSRFDVRRLLDAPDEESPDMIPFDSTPAIQLHASPDAHLPLSHQIARSARIAPVSGAVKEVIDVAPVSRNESEEIDVDPGSNENENEKTVIEPTAAKSDAEWPQDVEAMGDDACVSEATGIEETDIQCDDSDSVPRKRSSRKRSRPKRFGFALALVALATIFNPVSASDLLPQRTLSTVMPNGDIINYRGGWNDDSITREQLRHIQTIVSDSERLQFLHGIWRVFDWSSRRPGPGSTSDRRRRVVASAESDIDVGTGSGRYSAYSAHSAMARDGARRRTVAPRTVVTTPYSRRYFESPTAPSTRSRRSPSTTVEPLREDVRNSIKTNVTTTVCDCQAPSFLGAYEYLKDDSFCGKMTDSGTETSHQPTSSSPLPYQVDAVVQHHKRIDAHFCRVSKRVVRVEGDIVGGYDTTTFEVPIPVSGAECINLVRTQSCFGHAMKQQGRGFYHTHHPKGSYKWWSTSESTSMNCFVEPVRLHADCAPGKPCSVTTVQGLVSPDIGSEEGSIDGFGQYVWHFSTRASDPKCDFEPVMRGVGMFMNISDTMILRDVRRQADFVLGPLVQTGCGKNHFAFTVQGDPNIRVTLLDSSAEPLPHLEQFHADELPWIAMERHRAFLEDEQIEIDNRLLGLVHRVDCRVEQLKFWTASALSIRSPLRAAEVLGFPRCTSIHPFGHKMALYNCSALKLTFSPEVGNCGNEPRSANYSLGEDGLLLLPWKTCRWPTPFYAIGDEFYRDHVASWHSAAWQRVDAHIHAHKKDFPKDFGPLWDMAQNASAFVHALREPMLEDLADIHADFRNRGTVLGDELEEKTSEPSQKISFFGGLWARVTTVIYVLLAIGVLVLVLSVSQCFLPPPAQALTRPIFSTIFRSIGSVFAFFLFCKPCLWGYHVYQSIPIRKARNASDSRYAGGENISLHTMGPSSTPPLPPRSLPRSGPIARPLSPASMRSLEARMEPTAPITEETEMEGGVTYANVHSPLVRQVPVPVEPSSPSTDAIQIHTVNETAPTSESFVFTVRDDTTPSGSRPTGTRHPGIRGFTE